MVDTVILDSNDDLAFAGDLANGANLMSVLPGGTGYRIFREGDGSLDFDVSALTAGAIVQTSPTVGDTLTVSGSNAPAGATFQWQRDTGGGQADISGATSATYDTTGQPEGDYRRGVTFGVQGPVYTAAVTLGAAVPASLSGQLLAATGTKIKALYEFTDFANMKQNTAGSTAVTAVDDPVRYWTDLSGNGNHAAAITPSSPGNAIAKSGYINVNNSGFMISGIMSGATSGMEVYALIDRGSDTEWCLIGKSSASSHAAGIAGIGTSAPAAGFSGTITDYVDGVLVSPSTREKLYSDMIATAGYRVQSLQGINFSSESDVMLLAYSTTIFRLAGNAKCVFIAETLSAGERSSVDTILDGAK